MATITLARQLLREDLEIRHSDDALAVVLVYDGEGRCGAYDADDLDDRPLLRLHVEQLRDSRWEEVDGASVCTSLTVDDDPDVLHAAARYMHEQIRQCLREGRSVRRVAGMLSWMTARDAEAVAR